MKKSFIFIGILLNFALLNIKCNKSTVSNATLDVRLTDGPGNFQEVNVDLQDVEVNFSKDTSSWRSLSTKTGIYNLLNLQNGIDTLIAEANLPSGTLNEIRLILGANNSIKVNDSTFSLTIPSGAETGLKIKVNKPLQAIQTLTVDFNAGLSVIQEGDRYMLRPVLKIQ